MALILVECVVIAIVLKWVGFWIGSMLGLFALIMTLKDGKLTFSQGNADTSLTFEKKASSGSSASK